mgnify:CR=1 FL=1
MVHGSSGLHRGICMSNENILVEVEQEIRALLRKYRSLTINIGQAVERHRDAQFNSRNFYVLNITIRSPDEVIY